MFSKKEIKTFLIKYGSKWFFPDFSNKLTWFVVTLGASLVLLPEPLKLLFLNWLINVFNLNSGIELTLPEINSSTDYMAGITLIFLSLVHNLSYKYYDFFKEKLLHEKFKEKRKLARKSDIKLYKKLKTTLPHETIIFLEEHIWSVKFNYKKLEPLEIFLRHFKKSEFEFNSENIEKEKVKLYTAISDFSTYNAEIFFSAGHDEKSDVYYISVEHSWKVKNEKLYYSTQNKLTDLSNDIVIKYNDLIKACKSELGV